MQSTSAGATTTDNPIAKGGDVAQQPASQGTPTGSGNPMPKAQEDQKKGFDHEAWLAYAWTQGSQSEGLPLAEAPSPPAFKGGDRRHPKGTAPALEPLKQTTYSDGLLVSTIALTLLTNPDLHFFVPQHAARKFE